MARTKHAHPLGLTAYEWSVIVDCMNAHSQVENGHFLPAVAKHAAARRMVDRGFLTLVDELQPHRWPVVKITKENAEHYNAELAKVQDDQHP